MSSPLISSSALLFFVAMHRASRYLQLVAISYNRPYPISTTRNCLTPKYKHAYPKMLKCETLACPNVQPGERCKAPLRIWYGVGASLHANARVVLERPAARVPHHSQRARVLGREAGLVFRLHVLLHCFTGAAGDSFCGFRRLPFFSDEYVLVK